MKKHIILSIIFYIFAFICVFAIDNFDNNIIIIVIRTIMISSLLLMTKHILIAWKINNDRLNEKIKLIDEFNNNLDEQIKKMDKEIKMKVFISQPMKDKSEMEISTVRERAINDLKKIYGEDIEIIDSYITENPPTDCKNIPLWYFGKSIDKLVDADIFYSCPDWDMNRGCILEHEIAKSYGIKILNYNDPDLR